MVKSGKNPDGIPMEVFDGFREALSRNRAEFYTRISQMISVSRRRGPMISSQSQ